MDEYDDIGFDLSDLSGILDFEGTIDWADIFSPEQLKDFTDYEGAGFVADIAKEYPNYASMSNEELDAALGKAYTAAGLKVPEDKKSGFLQAAKKALTTPAGLAAAGTALYGLLGGGNQPQAAGYKGTIPTLTSVRERIQQPEYVPYSGQAVMGRQFFTPQQYVAPGEAAATRTAAQETAKQMESAIPKAPDAAVAPNTVKTQQKKIEQPVTASGILQDFLAKQYPTGGYEQMDLTGRQKVTPEMGRKMLANVIGERTVSEMEGLQGLVPAKEKPNFTAPFNPGQSLVQPIVNPTRPGEMAELEYYADNYADLWSQQPRGDGSNVMGPPAQTAGGQMMAIGQPATSVSTKVAGAAQGGIMQAAKGRYLRGETDGMADKIPSSIDGVQPAALSHGEFVIPADVVSHLGNGNSDAGAEQLYKMMDRVRKDRTGTTKQGKKINPGKYLGGGIADHASGGVAKFQTGGFSGLSPSGSNPFGSTATTTLAPYIGDYATGMLGRAQALAQSPYEAYTGPLTAGTSPLQQQAFTAAGQLDPSKRFGTEDLQTYMNPYTQLALQPQLDELRRQSAISQANLQGQFSKAGAFGGGREAIARTENLRNLGQLQAGVIGKGFENAFNQAMQQYNVGQQQQLSGIGALAGLGAQQRGIEQEGISALQKQFEQEKMDPYTKLQFQQSMMQGLPTGTTSVTPNLSELAKTGLTLKQATDIYEVLSKIPGFKESLVD